MVEWPNGNHCSVKWQNMEQVKRCQYTVDLRNCIFCSTKHTFSHESKRLTPVLLICVRYILRMHFLPFCFQNQGMKIVFLVLNNQMCQETVNLSLFHWPVKQLKAVTFKACELFSAYIDEPHDKYIVLPVSGVM